MKWPGDEIFLLTYPKVSTSSKLDNGNKTKVKEMLDVKANKKMVQQ